MPTTLNTCARCEQQVPADQLTTVINDGTPELWCDDCLDDAYCCERCETYHAETPETVLIAGDRELWCEHCAHNHATVCDSCNDLTANINMHTVRVWGVGYQDICSACLDELYYQCSNCGDYCLEDDVVYRDGYYYCPDCAPSSVIADYHHTDAEHFLNVPGDTGQPYLGVELEMEYPDDDSRLSAAEEILDHPQYGSYYECKEDGSLSDTGLEVVTQPATLAYHKAGYDQLMLDVAHKHGAVSHNAGNCGLHVHIDAAFFTDTGIIRALEYAGFIMDTLFSTCESQIVRFSRRSHTSLSHWAGILNMRTAKPESSLSDKLRDYRSAKYTRYQAVNLDNIDTIELRVFRGTLRDETYYATLEFVTGLAYLTRALLPVPEFAESLIWQDLKTEIYAALDTHGLSSDCLRAYMDRRGI